MVYRASFKKMLDFGFYNMDCIYGMRQFPDKFFDLAVVDPPYFSGPELKEYYGRKTNPIGARRYYEPSTAWEVPGKDYFMELERVSRYQIVWGCNYFDWRFAPGRIVWDKCNDKSDFSDCELAFCSLHDSVRIFRYMWNGMMQGKSINEGWIQQGNKSKNEKRIHPTQKPVNLYRWIAKKYIQPGWKVLDTHVGSASSLIAYEEAHIQYAGFEIDAKRYQAAMERLRAEKAQYTLEELCPGIMFN